ncbi:ELAV-like protein 1 isoform X2 [Amborella trichopoda]|uniref:RRM domain-containing protein n=2 Tax=Amborella trichopoda TaxID=13333 RepID=W1NYF9_AMBTC|nr:ELAV-like protein 1 isoform X2 [Amborella trichopoda]ERM99709.1 hypothetical protein AMTR_s00099p00085080 [Amborella trichopoda]|eukprot:XP_011620990.1 ELAV-like protein 1 isoform X2 [Amborella trichopoda]
MCQGNKKLVILGIPWEVDDEGLRQYMKQFGELVDVMVMKDRITGRSRGFGYVTFSSPEDAQKALAVEHSLNGRTLEIKVATPKEEMVPSGRKSTRIFVARIPPSVTDETFHSYFAKYGLIKDSYMPKDPLSRQHRGIGFVTFENPESVDKLMSETHELEGSTIAVDRATPKDDTRAYRMSNHHLRTPHFLAMPQMGGYTPVVKDLAALGPIHQPNQIVLPSTFPAQEVPLTGQIIVAGDTSSSGLGNGQVTVQVPRQVEKKMFVGRIPMETTPEDLQAYFSQFGYVTDVYLPKDAKKISHRGFGFVTFADEAAAARVTRTRHFIHGREIAIESATPSDRVPSSLGNDSDLPSEMVGVATENGSVAHSAPPAKWGKKLFVGRIPIEANAVDVRVHFSQYGPVLDVYLPKDDKKLSHRGFGFVTFADETSAEYACQREHRILGQKIVLDRAAPIEDTQTGMHPSSSVAVEQPSDGSAQTIVVDDRFKSFANQDAYNMMFQQLRGGVDMDPSRGAQVSRDPRRAARYRPY